MWLEKISAGEMTLAIAKQLTGCPAEVLIALSKKRGIPSEWGIKDAVRVHQIDEWISTTAVNAAGRGLTFLKDKRDWEMQREYTSVQQTSPAGLAKVLLPADTTLWAVTVETYSSKPLVHIWRPTNKNDDQVDGEPVELTDYQKWANERDRILDEHRQALAERKRLRTDIITDWAKTVATKDVAGAAMQYLFAWYDRDSETRAIRLGWEKPKADKKTQAAHLAEWYTHAVNLTAAVALILADGQFTPATFTAAKNLHVASILGPELPEPVIPPSPAVDHDDNSTDDENEDEDGGDDE